MAIADGLVALYTFENGDGRDVSGNAYNGTVGGAVSFGSDSFGKYMYCNGVCVNGSGTKAQSVIGSTMMNYTETMDFSRSWTGKIVSYPSQSVCGLFGSGFDCTVDLTTAGVLRVGIRASSGSPITSINAYATTPLNTVFTVGFKYVASETKFYVYLNGILQNYGGTTHTGAFLLNSWGLGDGYILSGNTTSCPHYHYNAKVRNRALTDLEMRTVTLVGSGSHRVTADGVYNTKAINTVGFDTTGLVAWYQAGQLTDSSGNGYTLTNTNATLTTGIYGESNGAYLYNGTSAFLQKISFGLSNRDLQTQFFLFYTTSISNSQALMSYVDYGTISIGTDGLVMVELQGTGSGRIKNTIPLQINTWYAIGVRYNNILASGTARVIGDADIFINGVKQGKTFASTGNATSTKTTLNIGVYNSSSLRFVGKIANSIFFNTAKTDAEINSLSKVLIGGLDQIKGMTYTNSFDATGYDRTSLIAEYLFAGNANDTSGNGINGTVTGATLTTDRHGAANSAYAFDGSTSYIEFTDSPWDITTNVSYSIGFNPSVIASTNLINKYNGTSTGHFQAGINADGTLFVIFRNASVNNQMNSKTTVRVGQWYDILITFNNSTGETKLYVNGILDNTNIQATSMGNNNANMTMGARASDKVGKFTGKIGYFFGWNRILTASEAYKLYREKGFAMGQTKGATYFTSLNAF